MFGFHGFDHSTTRFHIHDPRPQRCPAYAIHDTLVNWCDHYLLLADFASYVAAQDAIDALHKHTDSLLHKANEFYRQWAKLRAYANGMC